MFTKKFTLIGLALLLVAGSLALAPTVGAQTTVTQTTTEITLSALDAPVKPLSGLGVLSGKVTYTASGAGNTNLLGTPIHLKVAESPPWAVVTISPSTVYITIAEQKQTVSSSKDFKVLVATTADAPAFTPATLKISATSDTNGNIQGSNADTSVPISADFFSIIDARTDTPIQTGRPQTQLVYPIIISNFGNANSKVTLSLGSADNDLTVVVPPPVTLESKQSGGKQTQQTVNVQIQTPYHNGFLNKVGAVTVKMDSAYALDSKTKGDTSQLTLLTTTRGFYVPGFEPLFAVALIGLAALAIRRRSA